MFLDNRTCLVALKVNILKRLVKISFNNLNKTSFNLYVIIADF